MHLKNKSNPYVDALHDESESSFFSACPKTVFAAIAVSVLTVGGDYLEEARKRVLDEWWTLYDNQIVPQRPPFPRPQSNST